MMPIAFVLLALLPLVGPEGVVSGDSTETRETGLVKRKVRSFLSDESSGGRGLHLGPFLPRVENVSSGSGPGGVLHFWTPNMAGTRFDIHGAASYSINRYQHYSAEVGLVPHMVARRVRLRLDVLRSVEGTRVQLKLRPSF